MKTENREKRTGGTIDSWCGKCKRILAHTIETMLGNKPVRLHCNTCNAQHAYQPSERLKAVAQPAKPRANRYQGLLRASNGSSPKNYSTNEKYQHGDVLNHSSFGVGIATDIKAGNKIEVLFEGGPKLLVHGR